MSTWKQNLTTKAIQRIELASYKGYIWYLQMESVKVIVFSVKKIFSSVIILISVSWGLQSENEDTAADTLRFELRPVTVTASRLYGADLNVPVAVSVLSRYRIQGGQQQLVLNEALAAIPGLYTMNSENFAQDLRVSIRGFGARAAFGIRGIKILVDGIPESTPDGQTQVDNIDLGFINRVEVLRGPVSALYGNASGGVISFSSSEPPISSYMEGRLSTGDFGFQQIQLKAGQQRGPISYVMNFSRNQADGFREHSAMKNSVVNGKLRWEIDPNLNFTFLTNYAESPLAKDPGALTKDQVAENRSSARDRNVQYNSGESVSQFRIALVAEKKFAPHQTLQARVYFTTRDFENRLPFENGGQVQFNRLFSGSSIIYFSSGLILGIPYRLSAGMDLEDQQDDRQRFDNLEGVRGDKVLDQLEKFRSIGAFIEEELSINKVTKVTVGGRFDGIDVDAQDAYLEDGDASSGRTFTAMSPLLGVVHTLSTGINVYSNIATSFETPTLNELSNNPEGGGGFNADLRPQLATNYEIGIKGLFKKRLKYEMALFKIDLNDELVQYELNDFPGRTFYRNAGSSKRAGIEIGLTSFIGKGLTGSTVYTFSDFTYLDFKTVDAVHDGKMLPGIPKQFGYGELSYVHSSGFYFKLQARFSGELYADDANKVKEQPYSVMNIRVGYQKRFSEWLFEPFAGINNLFDKKYNSNVRLNAWGGRYFEPASGFHIYGGVRVRIGS